MNKKREPNDKRIGQYFELSQKKRRKILFYIGSLTAIPFIISLFMLFHLELMTENFAPLIFSGVIVSYFVAIIIVIWLWDNAIPNAITKKKGKQFWAKAVGVMVRKDEDNRNYFYITYESTIDAKKREMCGMQSFSYNPIKVIGSYYIRGFKYRKHYVLIENRGYRGIGSAYIYRL